MSRRSRSGRRVVPWILVPVMLVGSLSPVAGSPIGPASAFQPAATRELQSGLLLIADHRLIDPNFARTVVLLLHYSSEGAIGVIINRRSEIPVVEALSTVRELEGRTDLLYLGGPVSVTKPFVLVRAADAPAGALEVADEVYSLSDPGGLREQFTADVPPESIRVLAGYAGWAAGQLDAEVGRGDWHLRRASARWIFDEPVEEIWKELIRQALLPVA